MLERTISVHLCTSPVSEVIWVWYRLWFNTVQTLTPKISTAILLVIFAQSTVTGSAWSFCLLEIRICLPTTMKTSRQSMSRSVVKSSTNSKNSSRNRKTWTRIRRKQVAIIRHNRNQLIVNHMVEWSKYLSKMPTKSQVKHKHKTLI